MIAKRDGPCQIHDRRLDGMVTIDGLPEKQTILIVDDTPDNVALLSAMLKGRYRTKVATSGAKALEIAASDSPPDLILLDIMMPEMDGYEVCHRLKASTHTKEIPVIFLSALTDTLDIVKAFRAGAVDYVSKPYHAEEVGARVETHLKLHRLQMELETTNQLLREANERLRKYSSD